eukprot:Awhi_evm1s15699
MNLNQCYTVEEYDLAIVFHIDYLDSNYCNVDQKVSVRRTCSFSKGNGFGFIFSKTIDYNVQLLGEGGFDCT